MVGHLFDRNIWSVGLKLCECETVSEKALNILSDLFLQILMQFIELACFPVRLKKPNNHRFIEKWSEYTFFKKSLDAANDSSVSFDNHQTAFLPLGFPDLDFPMIFNGYIFKQSTTPVRKIEIYNYFSNFILQHSIIIVTKLLHSMQ